MSLTFGSVCSGIGAPEHAWRDLGWDCAFMSEIDPFPRAVLKHRFPETPLHGDFTTIQAGEYRPIRLLVGGTPCQSFSIAGARRGLADDRGNLALEYILLADRLRPDWVVWENVPGVFSSRPGDDPEADEDEGAELLGHNGGPVLDGAERAPPGSDFASFLSGLVRWEVPIPDGGWRTGGIIAPAPVDGAYGVAWRVDDAQFAGVPQRRRRVFVVGYIGDWRPAAAVLLEPHRLSGDSPPRRGERARAAGGAPQRAAFGGNNRSGPIEVAASLSANKTGSGQFYDFTVETFIAEPALPDTVGTLPAAGGTAKKHGQGWGQQEWESGYCIPVPAPEPIPFDTTQITSPSNVSHPKAGDPRHPLAAKAHPPAIAFSAKDYGGDAQEELSPTLRSGGFDQSHANGGVMPAVAFALRGREEGNVPEVHQDGQTVGTLRAAEGGSTHPMVAFSITPESGQGAHLRACEIEVAPGLNATSESAQTDRGTRIVQCATGDIHTLRAEGFDASEDGTGRGQPIINATAYAVRRLTPVECERLQGFPDHWTAIPWRGAAAENCPDGPRYKALGNSMAEPVVRRIGEAIAEVDALLRAIRPQGCAVGAGESGF